MYVLEGAGNYLSAHDLQLDDRILVLVDPFGCLHLQHEKKGFHPSRENEETHANLMK